MAGAIIVGGGCGDAPLRSAERFCGELAAHATEIRTAPESIDAIPAFITLFSKMGEVAPLDVQGDWERVYNSLKAAAAVDTADPASVQAVADEAYAAQLSAANVVTWATTNCALDLGPVGAVAGGAAAITPAAVTAPPAPGDPAVAPTGTVADGNTP